MIPELTHLDEHGNAHMVNVAGKPPLVRTAIAEGRVYMQETTTEMVRSHNIKKGDVLATARIAGIMAAKRTPDIIPLCHSVMLDSLSVELQVEENAIYMRAEAKATDRTGVEMEALTAVMAAGLSIYDMCKAVDKTMRIDEIQLVEKHKEAQPESNTASHSGTFTITSVNRSTQKGEKKSPCESVFLIEEYGIDGDAHAGSKIRQVSILAEEDIDSMRDKGLKLKAGDFAENITIKGMRPAELPIGTRLLIGDTILEVSKIGKECHHGCEIKAIIGDCVMPRAGVFARVIKGGEIRNGYTGMYYL